MYPKLSNYIVISDSLDGSDSLQSERIVYSTRTGKGIKITNFVLELIMQGQYATIPDRLFTILMYHEIIVPAEENELDMIIKRKQLTSIDLANDNKCILVNSDCIEGSNVKDKIVREINFLLDNSKDGKPIDSIGILIIINTSLEEGFKCLDILRNTIQELRLSGIDIYYKLHISLKNISTISEFLPLKNPDLEEINLVYRNDGSSSLLQYLKTIASLFKFHEYLSLIPVNIYLNLGATSYMQLPDSLQALKALTAFRNLQLNVIPINNSPSESEILEKVELKILKFLEVEKIRINFIPKIDSKYFNEKAFKAFYKIADFTSFSRAGVVDDIYEINNFSSYEDTDMLGGARVFYDKNYIDALLENKTKCSSCVYLPLCGGRINKSKKHDLDCPPFTKNFVDKFKYLYNFSIAR